MKDAQIFVFGDSITWGGWDTEGGWVARLRKYADEKVVASNFEYYREIHNLGVSGNNTEALLKRFDSELSARRDKEDDCAILFAIGINDSQFRTQENRHRVEIGQFEKNLRALVQKAWRFTDNVAFVGLSPVDDIRTDPIPWAPDRSYNTEYVQAYDAVIKNVCVAEDVSFIPVFEKFLERDCHGLLVDGVHPNNEGHALIADIVRTHLEECGWI